MEARLDATSRSLDGLVLGLEDRIRSAAGRFSLDESDVQEVLQEVRIRIWKARGETGDIESTPAGYVYRAAMSAAVDLIRRRRRRRTVELSPSLPAREVDDPHRAVESAELGRKIGSALARLSERRRPVVRMYLAGYGSAEIAELMGWTEPKARNLLYRGLDDLRARLGEMGVGTDSVPRSERNVSSRTSSGVKGSIIPPEQTGGGAEP